MTDHPTPQLTRDDLAEMTDAEIVAAKARGRLDQLFGRPPAVDPDKPNLTRDDLRRMSPEEIVAAKARGRLDHLLGGRA